MAVKITLILAFVAQVVAALLALRLNFRYRIYSAWFFVSAAASVGAILRLTTLLEIWQDSPTIEAGGPLWTTALASLLASILLMAAMCLIEPFFKQVAQAQETLQQEHRELTSIVRETEDELRLAQRIQRQLLPTDAPQLPQLDVYGASEPAEWTSGDYFDYLQLEDGGTAIIIADVSGHGLGPALLMSSTRASFRALASRVSDVGELLTFGNQAVVDAVSGRGFVTAFAVRYDWKLGTLYYAAAGHTAYLLKRDGSSLELAAQAPPLGVMPELLCPEQQQTGIAAGDLLILVTDGILEATNRKGESFGDARLLRTVSEHRQQPAQQIVAALFEASRVFGEQQSQPDDNTAVVVKFV